MTATAPTSEPHPIVRTLARVVGNGADEAQRARDRSALLQGVTHAGVCVPVSVSLASEGEVVATFPYVQGTTLQALLQSRAPLTLGECVFLGVQVAEALDAMHSSGVTHGDVSPANVMVTESGVVLVDTLADISGREEGTQGYVAPERAAGATREADAYSLGLLLRWAADDDAKAAIAAWTKPLCEHRPGDRETVAHAAVALRECAPAEPIVQPTLNAADAVRSRALDPAGATVVRPEARSWRVEAAVRRWAPKAGIAAAALIVVLIVARAAGGGGGGETSETAAIADAHGAAAQWEAPEAGQRDAPRVAVSEVEVAAERATRERVDAIARADGDALLGLTVQGSASQQRDAELAELLASGLVEYQGLTVTSVRVTGVVLGGDSARATVSYAVSESRLWEGDEWNTEPAFEETVTLVLRQQGKRWLVEDVISRR